MAPPPAGPPAPRGRPSGWWFVVGASLLVAAAVVGVGLFVMTLVGFMRVDVSVPADGEPHRVSVPVDGDRFLWLAQSTAGTCAVRDDATGAEIALRPVAGQFSRTSGGSTWVASARFDPGSGELVVTCVGSAGTVEIGPAVKVGGFVGGILGAILLPMALAAAGLVVLLVAGVLYVTRPVRPHQP